MALYKCMSGSGNSGELVTNLNFSMSISNREDTFTCNSSGTFYYNYGGYTGNYTQIWLNNVEQTAVYQSKSESYGYKGSFAFTVQKGDSIKRFIRSSGNTHYCELGVIL